MKGTLQKFKDEAAKRGLLTLSPADTEAHKHWLCVLIELEVAIENFKSAAKRVAKRIDKELDHVDAFEEPSGWLYPDELQKAYDRLVAAGKDFRDARKEQNV